MSVVDKLTTIAENMQKVYEAGKAAGGGEVTPPVPSDGKTRIYIHLENGRTSPMLGCCPNGTVTVDWGDGTEPDTLTGTSKSTVKWTPTHNYAEAGDYVISLTVHGSMGFYGSSGYNQYSGILRYSDTEDARNYAYRNAVRKVEIGDGVTSIGNYAFYYCYSLESVTIPECIQSIGNYAFSYCYSLKNVTIPEGVTSIGDNAFYYCNALASVTIPEGVTSIGNYAFCGCYSLASVTIPKGVRSIGDNAFYYCYSLANVTIPEGVTIGSYAFSYCYCVGCYDFTSCTDVPPLRSTNVFTNISTDCKMLIPEALYSTWRNSTYWSTYASYMVAV